MTSTYDFIIVGGGTAGLVVANRLTENPKIQVLVFEAGKNHADDPRVKTPALYSTLFGTEAHWGFETSPQPNLENRKINISPGRALGGSSAVNAEVFVPPSKTIIDAWVRLGNLGWDWNIMKPYYAKMHSVQKVTPEMSERMGIGLGEGCECSGPIQTSYSPNYGGPVPQPWNKTFENAGYKMTGDPFHGSGSGAFQMLASIDPVTHERSYAVTAYYAPIAARKNLHVLTECTVENITFKKEGSDYEATGIQFIQDGQAITANASREVILAAGTLQSPKILELSGIGDSKLLNSLGIEVLVDNPHVGENLQDHIWCGIGFEAKDDIPTLDALKRQEPDAMAAAMAEYASTKTGPLASLGLSSFAYLPLLHTAGQATLKELLDGKIGQSSSSNHPASQDYYDIARSILEDNNDASIAMLSAATQIAGARDYSLGNVLGKFISIVLLLSNPLSRGSVHITSASVNDAPSIDPRYLSHALDLEIYARHMQYLEELVTTEPFASALIKPNGRMTSLKSCKDDLEAAKEHIRRNATSMWHPTSTCAMLPKDQGGVVDERLRVYGTKKLRIVDASVMPLIPRANIQSSVYAVAERAADLIKEDYWACYYGSN
ncbi:GMC oxidoreductase [Cadophora sp. DSE1049]|nr:GMC oxidoreductase [Cadophora sp. DSE1049]